MNSRASSRKSPVPELDFSNKNNQDIETFIDQTEKEDLEEPALANLRKFQTLLVFVGGKIDHYARLVTLRKVREFSYHEKPSSTAYHKAGRCLCLIMKAFTCMDNNFRQIKEEELF